MILKYLGHASFLIKSKTTKLITDPFDPKSVGLKYPKQEAQIVTVSHHHKDHDYVAGVSEDALVIDWPGEFEKGGIRIFGYPSWHDKSKGKERGENSIYKIEVDDISILHCGDLGEIPDDEKLDEIGEVDILLVPVGGHYTISAEEAVKLIHKIEPSIVIPMHYKTEGMNPEVFDSLTTLENFIKLYGTNDPETLDQLTLKKEELPQETKLVILTNNN